MDEASSEAGSTMCGRYGRLYRTLRPLSMSQLAWRVRGVLRRKLKRLPLPPAFPGTAIRDDFPAIPVMIGESPPGAQVADDLANGRLTLLNQTFDFPREDPDWRLGPQARDRLWTITLHYHAWLCALAEQAAPHESTSAGELLALHLDDWLTRCDITRTGARELAWNPYAIATRAGWWIRLHQQLSEDWRGAHGDLESRFRDSLWRQAWLLARTLEKDLRANHYLRDAVGLAWLGRFFSPDGETERWLHTAKAIAMQQIPHQILPDGGHYERSPMYHLNIMEDMLVLATLLEGDVREMVSEMWPQVAACAAWMRHPDGGVVLFNDGAIEADAQTRLFDFASQLGMAGDLSARRGGRHLAHSGVAIWHGEPWSVFFDVGDVGPDEQPGHAHADSLTVECSFSGHRLIVDPGTYHYDRTDIRRYDRATDSHNTVCVDGHDSSEVWDSFRLGRRAKPRDVSVKIDRQSLIASAAHDGYHHLPGKPMHQREITVADGGAIEITDSITGSGAHDLAGGWLIDPVWHVETADGGWRLRRGDDVVNVTCQGPAGMVLSIVQRPYHPDYGVEHQTHRLVWRIEQAALPVKVHTVFEGSGP